jgi:hypothetical protein
MLLPQNIFYRFFKSNNSFFFSSGAPLWGPHFGGPTLSHFVGPSLRGAPLKGPPFNRAIPLESYQFEDPFWGPPLCPILWGLSLSGGSHLRGFHSKRTPKKWDPVFMRGRAIPPESYQFGAPTFGAPTLPHVFGALFEWGPQLMGSPLKESPHKMGSCSYERQKIELFP